MNRFLSVLKNDFLLQVRNNLYTIGISVAAILAIGISQLANPVHMFLIVPTLILMIIGGSTFFYIAGLILFEKDENTLNAIITSPLKISEYLWSKVLTLSMLATLEGSIVIGGTMGVMMFSEAHVPIPNFFALLLGIISIGIIYSLIGVILVVRYDKITDCILPMTAGIVLLQLPLIYFSGLVQHYLFLIIPTSAPIMIVRGAYVRLPILLWIYAITYTIGSIVVFSLWAKQAFAKHIRMKVG